MAVSDATAVGFSVAAVASSGPLYAVFNEMGLLMALMGGLGGALYVLRHNVPLSHAVRPVVSGALLSFGAGVWAVPIVAKALGFEIANTQNSVPALAGAAFFMGFLQERILAKISRKKDQ